ncbi:MAG: hypothetical protein FWH20_10290 [Oscillospiraceae bacterium]|nr:hypothetical protein [Oscillospiraceae bacterium]
MAYMGSWVFVFPWGCQGAGVRQGVGGGGVPNRLTRFRTRTQDRSIKLNSHEGGVKPPFETYEVREMHCGFLGRRMRG